MKKNLLISAMFIMALSLTPSMRLVSAADLPETVSTITCVPIQQFAKTKSWLGCRITFNPAYEFQVAEITLPFRVTQLMQASSGYSGMLARRYPPVLAQDTIMFSAVDWGVSASPAVSNLQTIPLDALSFTVETDQPISEVKKAFQEKRSKISFLSPIPSDPENPVFYTTLPRQILSFDGTLILESFTQYVSPRVLQFLRLAMACYGKTPETCLANVIQNLASSVVSTAAVSSSIPPDFAFLCSDFIVASKSSQCMLQVPADMIGANFIVDIPSQKLSALQKLKKIETLYPEAQFFRLEAPLEAGKYRLKTDFGDLKTGAKTTPYRLLQFELVPASDSPAQFPLIISASFLVGGEIYTPQSVIQNQPSFRAAIPIPMEIRINYPGTGTGIGSSFRYDVDREEGLLRGSAEFPCFDDPFESMTSEEWLIICKAKNRGIISGNPLPNGIFFLPNQPINRAEAVKIATLGILRSLGKLKDADFTTEEETIRKAFPRKKVITYPDIAYEKNGDPPWFAVFVNIASKEKIVQGYPQDGTYKPANTINNAESYRIIVETGRIASAEIADALRDADRLTRRSDWFAKYAATLEEYEVPFSEKYGEFTTRKEFLLIVMNLLKAVGL